MALPELIANTFKAPIATLAATLGETAVGPLEASTPAPGALTGEGQFHLLIGKEILVIEAASAATTKWVILERGVEGTTKEEHAAGASLYNELTAGALDDRYPARNGDGRISRAAVSTLNALGNVNGVTALNLLKATTFTCTLTGAAVFKLEEIPTLGEYGTLWVTQDGTGGHTWSIEGISWVGSEPTFSLTKGISYAVTLFALEGKLYGIVGLEGPEGKAGKTIYSGESAPSESLGLSGDLYIRTKSGVAESLYGPKVGTEWGSSVPLRGETGAKGATGSASIEGYLKTVLPVWAGGSPRATSYSAIGTSFEAVFSLVCLPAGGTLHDLAVINGETVNGNHNVAVFDTGQAKAGEYTLLWESGSVAATGAQERQIVGDPALSGRETGERLLIAIMNSGTTHTFGVQQEFAGNLTTLMPSSYGYPARLVGMHKFAELKFAKITEAQLEAFRKTVLLTARVV